MKQVRPGTKQTLVCLVPRTDLFHDVGRMPDNSKTRRDFESARGSITQCIIESGNLRELLLAWFPSRTSSMMLVEQ